MLPHEQRNATGHSWAPGRTRRGGPGGEKNCSQHSAQLRSLQSGPQRLSTGTKGTKGPGSHPNLRAERAFPDGRDQPAKPRPLTRPLPSRSSHCQEAERGASSGASRVSALGSAPCSPSEAAWSGFWPRGRARLRYRPGGRARVTAGGGGGPCRECRAPRMRATFFKAPLGPFWCQPGAQGRDERGVGEAGRKPRARIFQCWLPVGPGAVAGLWPVLPLAAFVTW